MLFLDSKLYELHESRRNQKLLFTEKAVTESFPFDDTTLVFKVMNKMFALISLDTDPSMNLKCDPDKAIDLRERYTCVFPGYHMNKRLWNTIKLDDSVPDQLIKEWIDDSYELVVEKLPKKDQRLLL